MSENELDELGGVSFGMLELGDASFRISENELGELGAVSFGILELGDASFRISENELGELGAPLEKIIMIKLKSQKTKKS